MRAKAIKGVPIVSEILSQAEIEALLNSLNDGEGEAAPEVKAASGANPRTERSNVKKSTVAYEVYDFRRPDKFSKDQLRTLQMLHETFARLSGSALSAYLRSPVTVDLISLEQVPYEEYLRSINQSVFTILSLPPLSGQAVLEVEFGLVFSMIDRMLGGPGKGIPRAVLTDIERPLVRQILERLFTALKTAWEGVVIVSPGIEGMETSAQFVQIAPPSDIVVTILLEVKIGSQRGAMSLCIPYVLLKPITAKLSGQKWFVTGTRKGGKSARNVLTHQLQGAQIDCSVHLGNAHLSMHEFMNLKPGDVLRLDQRTERDLRLLVEDVPKFHGKPALQGKKVVFAVSNPIEE